METTELTARGLFEQVRSECRGVRYPFGTRPALINVDLQHAYTCVGRYPTAYAPGEQLAEVSALARLVRGLGGPVVWTYCAYEDSGEDCGIWGTRSDTPDSLQNIAEGSHRAALDERLEVEPSDLVMRKRMPSAFFETNLPSLLVYHRVDTVLVTGGSTSGCIRATVVDAISHGYRTFVPLEAVSDKHESPHYANLYDLTLKYADVRSVAEVKSLLATAEKRV